MNIATDRINLVNELRSRYHDISNFLVTTSLTLELCDIPSDMTQNDFDSLKDQVASIIENLRRSQELLVHLSELLAVNNTTHDQMISDELM